MSEKKNGTLDVNDAVAFVASATGKAMEECQTVIQAWVSLLKNEIQERSNKMPHLIYGQVQEGNYEVPMGPELRFSGYMPSDYWIPLCRESKREYGIVETIIVSFAKFLATNANECFAPVGTLNLNESREYPYSFLLRPDFIPQPTTQQLVDHEKQQQEIDELVDD
jgi:hypothetical protein